MIVPFHGAKTIPIGTLKSIIEGTELVGMSFEVSGPSVAANPLRGAALEGEMRIKIKIKMKREAEGLDEAA